MADDSIKISIELDDGTIIQTFGKIKKAAQDTGKSVEDNLGGKAVKGFSEALEDVVQQVPGLNAVKNLVGALPTSLKAAAVAAVAVKEALDLTLAGEQVNAIATQFETLTKNVGLSGLALKQDFIDRANGLVQADDITKALNKSIVELGTDAAKLGPVFDVALKATTLFGGTAVQNFESLSSAIATGNTRALRNLGIIIDAEKAYDDYAKTIGRSGTELSLAGRQQALLNAVIEQGTKAFNGIDPTALQATTALTRFTNAITDLYQAVQSVIANTLGPVFSKVFNDLANVVNYAANTIQANFGKGIDAVIAQQEVLRADIEQTERKIADLQEKSRLGILANQEPFIAAAQAELVKLRAELASTEEQIKSSKASVGGAGGNQASQIQQQVIVQEEARRQTLLFERLKTEAEILANQQKAAQDEQTQDIILAEQKANLKHQEELNLQMIDQQYKQANLLDTQAHADAKLLIEQQYQQRLMALEEQAQEKRKQRTKEVNDVINRSIQQGIVNMTQQTTKDLLKGQMSWDKFGKAIIGVVGDMAISLGTYAIAQGAVMQALGSNPFTAGGATIVAGIALIAIGTALKSFSGEGGGATTGIGTSAVGSGSDAGSAATQQQEQERVVPSTAINVNVQGNIVDSRETGLWISEVIQNSFDLNGTKIVTGVT